MSLRCVTACKVSKIVLAIFIVTMNLIQQVKINKKNSIFLKAPEIILRNLKKTLYNFPSLVSPGRGVARATLNNKDEELCMNLLNACVALI